MNWLKHLLLAWLLLLLTIGGYRLDLFFWPELALCLVISLTVSGDWRHAVFYGLFLGLGLDYYLLNSWSQTALVYLLIITLGAWLAQRLAVRSNQALWLGLTFGLVLIYELWQSLLAGYQLGLNLGAIVSQWVMASLMIVALMRLAKNRQEVKIG
ncbi:MAG: hypothetical protein CEO22_596 [Candidatus Berkelbacteria bacterium Gr01-1014_85]|uniref:Rod shape-determining protein MreD n=1 Tax=Candidatus Berkelbacteria bacterium Gr01-1014_85 TaxID=2017150 RepID=A0A554JA04_9BACT|nr:MAG: hypothetical protein CEO22_596 [Candidatus Berkelbacteria bacterium Gr01-1014_85]